MKITKGRAEFMELTEAIRIAMDREAILFLGCCDFCK